MIFEDTGTSINIIDQYDFNSKELFDLVIKRLKEKEIYNYDLYCSYSIKVKAKEGIINKLKQADEYNYQSKYDNELNNCYDTQDDYLEQVYALEKENDELRWEIEELENKITQYEDQLEMIKENLD